MPRNRESSDRLKLVLVDAPEDAEAPKLAVYALDAAGEISHSAEVSAQGEARMTAAAMNKADKVVVAPAGAKKAADLSAAEQVMFHADYIRDVIAEGAELEIPIG